VAHDRLGNVTLHFEDDERVPSANAQREGNFEVNRTKLFYCVVSHVLESGERLRAMKTGEGNSGEDVCVPASLRLFQSDCAICKCTSVHIRASRTVDMSLVRGFVVSFAQKQRACARCECKCKC